MTLAEQAEQVAQQIEFVFGQHAYAETIRQCAAALASQQAGKGEPQKLWLWKNFVGGRPEYWAFDNAYPIHMNSDDPQTLGPPCGYALVKVSRAARHVPDEQVLKEIARSASPPSREPLTEWDIRGMLARLKCWHRLTEQEADELVQFAMQGGIHSREGETK